MVKTGHIVFDELRNRIACSRLAVLSRKSEPGGHDYSGSEVIEKGANLLTGLSIPAEERIVLLLLPHSAELFLLQIALAIGGQIPAVLPWPTSRVDAGKYQRNLLHQLSNLPAARMITLPSLATNLRPWLPFPVTGIAVAGQEIFEQGFSDRFECEPVGDVSFRPVSPLPDDTLFLQFSGGTTGTQKCVAVRAGMLRSQLERLQATLSFTERDVVVSWLPIYHDMGLIACLWLPLWCGGTAVQIGVGDWLLAPERLCEAIFRYQGTYCWLPNFAFSYLAQRREAMQADWDLSSMRGWINCSEPVRLRSLREFEQSFSDRGVQAWQLQASYAMAETVFAVTQTTLGQFPRTVTRKEVAGISGELAFSLGDDVFVSSGNPLRDTEIRVRTDKDGIAHADAGVPGQIEIRSPSLFDGYWGNGGFSAGHLTDDGWYRSGDHGFILDGQLYVIGRSKDLIIVAGQNIQPEDVESVVNEIRGVYPGRVVAFGVDDQSLGTQALAIVAELRDGTGESDKQMEQEIRSKVIASIGVAPRYVYVVRDRWVVKSTAGKISRKDTREKFMSHLVMHGPVVRDARPTE